MIQGINNNLNTKEVNRDALLMLWLIFRTAEESVNNNNNKLNYTKRTWEVEGQ